MAFSNGQNVQAADLNNFSVTTVTTTGTITAGGALTASSTLAVTGATTLSGVNTLAGATTASTTLTVTGALTASSTLAVTGISTFTGDVRTVAWTDYTATSTIVGWSSFVAGRKFIMYKKIGKLVFVAFHLEGTSDAANATFTVPFTAVTVGTVFSFNTPMALGYDNGVAQTTGPYSSLANNTATVLCFSAAGGTVWTASGSKIVSGQFWYETA